MFRSKNSAAIRAVIRAAYMAVHHAVIRSAHKAVYFPVHNAVPGGGTVDGRSMERVVVEDPPHPALGDFLREVGV